MIKRPASLLSVFLTVALMLFVPVSAFAATNLTIEAQEYTAAASGEGGNGGTWQWDGNEALSLNSFQSENPISATGSLTISLTGENTTGEIAARMDEQAEIMSAANLEISGEGSLTADSLKAYGNLSIEDTTVNIEYSKEGTKEDRDNGIYAMSDLVIKDSEIDIAMQGTDQYALTGIEAGSVTIQDSELQIDIKANDGVNTSGIESAGAFIQTLSSDGKSVITDTELSADGNIAITNSEVSVNLAPEGLTAAALGQWFPDGGAYSDGSIVLTDAKIETPELGIRTITNYYGQNVQVIAPKGDTIDYSPYYNEEKEAELDAMLSTANLKIVRAKTSNPAQSNVAYAATLPTSGATASPVVSATAQTADPISTSTIAAVAALALFAACGLLAVRKVQK